MEEPGVSFSCAQKSFEASLEAGSSALRKAASALDDFRDAAGKWEKRRGLLAAVNLDSTMMRAEQRGQQEISNGALSFERCMVKLNASIDAMRNSCSQMAQAAADARAHASREFASDPDLGLAHTALMMSQCAAMYQNELALKEAIYTASSQEPTASELSAFECAWKNIAYVDDRRLQVLLEELAASSENSKGVEQATPKQQGKKKKKQSEKNNNT